MSEERLPSSLTDDQRREDQDRREFLAKCGRFAAVTPPAMTMLLSTTLSGKAIAKSGGVSLRGGGGGGGSGVGGGGGGGSLVGGGGGSGGGGGVGGSGSGGTVNKKK